MKKILRFAVYTVAGLAVIAALAWWAIGPTWRTFLSDPPSDTDVLFWTQSQRDTGFALSDQLPIVDTAKIEAGNKPYELTVGEDLNLSTDLAAYMESQNSAAVVVLHKGEIRLEEYRLNQNTKKRWTSFSVAKSVTSTLVGTAIEDGHINSLDDFVSDYVEGLKGSAYDDVTIEQLLTMTSGVDWDEDYDDPNSDVAVFSAVEPVEGEPSIVTYLKKLPRAHPPGAEFNYSTGETNLVGILVEASTQKTLAEYLSEKIWRPYGMEQKGSWVISKTGEAISGCCIQATARDYARIGQFMLDGGVIDDASILPDGWIEAATTTRRILPDDEVRNYGYQWWTLDEGAYMAIGIFGQGIFIDPKRELVLVTHSSWVDARGNAAGQKQERYAFFDAVRAAVDAE